MVFQWMNEWMVFASIVLSWGSFVSLDCKGSVKIFLYICYCVVCFYQSPEIIVISAIILFHFITSRKFVLHPSYQESGMMVSFTRIHIGWVPSPNPAHNCRLSLLEILRIFICAFYRFGSVGERTSGGTSYGEWIVCRKILQFLWKYLLLGCSKKNEMSGKGMSLVVNSLIVNVRGGMLKLTPESEKFQRTDEPHIHSAGEIFSGIRDKVRTIRRSNESPSHTPSLCLFHKHLINLKII